MSTDEMTQISTDAMRHPYWIRRPVLREDVFAQMRKRLGGVNTVCQSARCPNIGECFSQGKATFLILGTHCSRRCGFCAVPVTYRVKGQGSGVKGKDEIERIVSSVRRLGLRHVVITSVTRDDLSDGGASVFRDTIIALRKLNGCEGRSLTIEVLVPDFQGRRESIEEVLVAGSDIFAHNIETVPRLYSQVRMGADYNRSLGVLRLAEMGTHPNWDVSPFTKSGIMLGLGEREDEVLDVFSDLKNAGVNFLTVGQYLRPTKENLPVVEYIHPDKFREFKERAYQMGFLHVESGPFVRSSYAQHENNQSPRYNNQTIINNLSQRLIRLWRKIITNNQTKLMIRKSLVIGYWVFEFVWCLELGYW